MTRQAAFAFVILAATSGGLSAQSENRVESKDSVTVSAGIPREQLALEAELGGIVSQADRSVAAGSSSDAIAQYRKAIDFVQKHPVLAEREETVQKKLARACLYGNRVGEAVSIYAKLLEARKSDCAPSSPALAGCADAQYELAVAEMTGSDFSAAIPLLQQAEANYSTAGKFASSSHDLVMIQRKNEAQTSMMIAVSLARTGKTVDAIKAIRDAISGLQTVQSDLTINIGIRNDAAASLQQANVVLSRLNTTQ